MKKAWNRPYTHRKVYKIPHGRSAPTLGEWWARDKWWEENCASGDHWKIGNTYYTRDGNAATLFRLKFL